MKKLFFIILPTIILLSACGKHRVKGEGETVAIQQKEITGFSGVYASAPVKLNIAVGGTATSCVFKGQENITKHLTATLNGSVLEIGTDIKNISFNTTEPVEVNISLPTLERLKLSGSSEANVTGNNIGAGFYLTISGAGNATIQNIQVGECKADISGSGDVRFVSGSAASIAFVVSGAGNIKAFGLIGKNVEASVSGAGDIELFAETKLTAKVSGAGNITYKGTPKLNSNISGAGSVEQAK